MPNDLARLLLERKQGIVWLQEEFVIFIKNVCFFHCRECVWKGVSYHCWKITILWSTCNLRPLLLSSITIYLPSSLRRPRCRSIRSPRLSRRWHRDWVSHYLIRRPKWKWLRIKCRQKCHMCRNICQVRRSHGRWNRGRRSTPKRHGLGKNRYQRSLYNRKNYGSYIIIILSSIFWENC